MYLPWPFTARGWTPLRGAIGLAITIISLAAAFCRLHDFPVLLMAGALVLMATYWYRLEDLGVRDEAILRRRLVGYAKLGNEPNDERLQRNLLSRAEHQILLGTLKKVEQKAASLAAVLVFIAIAIVTVGATSMASTASGRVYYCLLVPLLPLFICVTFAFKQVDNISFNRSDSRSDAEQLQKTLIDDLLQKEHCFRFSLYCTIAYGGLAFFWLLSTILCF